MKKSSFNIVQEYQNHFLLYNTLSTSIVEIERELYNQIFEMGDYSLSEVKALYEMGFLVDDNCNEVQEMRLLRDEVIKNSSEKIGNIIIAPTLECNAHCYYCFENGYRKGIMNQKTADALIKFLEKNWNGEKLGITWFGGEPILASEIIDYITQKLIGRGVKVGCKITTNGSLIDENIISKMVNYWCVEKVQITIDAIGEEYNKIKNYDKNIDDPFGKVMNNIEKLLLNDIKVKIRINFDPEKQESVLETFNYLVNKFNKFENLKIYFAPIDNDENIVRNIVDDFDDFDEHPYISLIKFGRKNNLYRGFPDVEEYDDIKEDANILLKKLKIFPSTINCYASCPNVFSVAPNGDLYKCHRVLGREEYSSGNVVDGIKNNNAYKFFCNTEMTYDECKECNVLPICQGGCKVNAKLFSGKEACAPCKAIIKDLILLYKEDLENIEREEEKYESY